MVVLGLGSSDPQALAWLRRGVSAIKAIPGLKIEQVSAIYRSDAMLPAGAPESWRVPYLNSAVSIAPRGGSNPKIWQDPHALLELIKGIERLLGRRDRERWAPREIDIDMLSWQGTRLASDRLTLPHPGVLSRPFALLPLQDVWSDCGDLGPEAIEIAQRWRKLPASQVPFGTERTLLRLTELVGILNATPDSFSDGGKYELATQGRALLEAGATVLDLGAESTRPGAEPVTPEVEWQRLEPALKSLLELKREPEGNPFALSLDSRNPATVSRALDYCGSRGCTLDWLNDVGGFSDPGMIELALESGACIVFMHSLGVPPQRSLVISSSDDPVKTVMSWAEARIKELGCHGISRNKLIFDPGIGFGKTQAQNLELLKRASKLHELGLPILVGHSRKAYLESSSQVPADERDLETAMVSAHLAEQGMEYLRVHHPATQARALRFSAAWSPVARYGIGGQS